MSYQTSPRKPAYCLRFLAAVREVSASLALAPDVSGCVRSAAALVTLAAWQATAAAVSAGQRTLTGPGGSG